MPGLVAIAHPHEDKFAVVLAEPLGQGRYRLLEDCLLPGYVAGDIVEEYGMIKNIPKVQKASDKQ